MLRELKIVNLAVIEELHLSFPGGLIVLTGETGAGKSIILQAIHLLSGGRASGDLIRTGAESGSVEALFEIGPRHEELRRELRLTGFAAGDEVIFRRVLTAGKSRCYINGSLATAGQMGLIAEHLLSVASQHDHQQLLHPGSHLDYIDAIGGHWPARQELGGSYDQWRELRSDLLRLRESESEKERRRDFLSFQLREITEAGLQPGEDEALSMRKERLKSSGTLTRLGRESCELLGGTVLDNLGQIRRNLDQMAALDPDVAGPSEKISGHFFELEEHLTGLRTYLEQIPDDPAELDRIMSRIDLLQRLKRKYGPSLEEVIARGREAQRELDELDGMDRRLTELTAAVAESEKSLVREAAALSGARRSTAARLAGVISDEIENLCLRKARFEIDFEGSGQPDLAEMGRTGCDRPRFMFSANPGEPVKPLARIASGGELSRLMLALKCILARNDRVETIIFDEVDAGISGQAAEAVARKIRELSGHHQVLCITHLPQIASCAGEHFQVSKSVAGERTRTTIRRLTEEARVEELARMLDGDSATPRTRAYARELLERNRQKAA